MTWLRRIPLTVRLPLLVAVLMIAISAAISERVMSRLAETQERHLTDLASAYLDGISGALVPHLLHDDIWEVFDTVDRSLALYQSVRPVETIVTGPDGMVIAATDPHRVPTLGPLPEAYREAPVGAVQIDAAAGEAHLRRTIRFQGTEIGSLYTRLDIAPLLAERSSVFTVLIVTNGALTLLFAAVGALAARRVIAPMRVLTQHMASSGGSPPRPISPGEMPLAGGEAYRLMAAYNSLVAAEEERARLASQLATEERLASLGRLASGMAHEINNPLGGLFNGLDTIRRHGGDPSVRARSVALIERGLDGIRDIVMATLETYRPGRAGRPFGSHDFDDIRLLSANAVRQRQLRAEWHCQLTEDFVLASPFVRQAVLNLVLNAIAASPAGGRVRVEARLEDSRLMVSVSDSGAGLTAAAERILAGDAAPVGEPDGLGLRMVRRVVSECGGTIHCAQSPIGGASITLVLRVLERMAARETSDEAA